MFNNNTPSFGLPPVVKNLLVLNVLFFLGAMIAESSWHFDLARALGLHYYESPYFRPWQYLTYMFMHGGFMHIFFNMYALWMFGKVLEMYWGPKRFLIYYFVTGIGAALLHTFVNWWTVSHMQAAIDMYLNTPSPDTFSNLVKDHFPQYSDAIVDFVRDWNKNLSDKVFISETRKFLEVRVMELINIPTVGASGAVFGVLLAFGMTFPNTQLMLLIPPIPIKAKYFVILYGGIEFYSAILNQPGDNVAHFAHLGGMLFGFILLKYWKNKPSSGWN